jgi:hypothetical protein
MMKSLLVLVVFISVSQLSEAGVEVAPETIDESFEHKIYEPKAQDDQERTVAGQKEEKKLEKKSDEPKVKYWQYHPEVGPKY